ncbi:MAG: cell division protein FtsQ/DivIB [Rickettsiales bacterium]|nr:cell division protein FtsQ/DivIB [Rickettsiales bacterium]
MVARYSKEQEVIGYLIGKIFKRFLRIFCLGLLLFFVYLASYDRKKLNLLLAGVVPASTKVFVERVVAGYRKNLCQKFTIEGIKFSDYSRVDQYIGQNCQRGDFDLRDLESILEEDPWIRKFYMHRTITGGLKMTVIEYNPFAIFTSDYVNYYLLNEFGTKIDIPVEEVSNFSYLFTIVDDDFSSEEINSLFNVLSVHQDIAKNISTFVRIGDRRWDLKLKNGVLVKMPEESDAMVKALATLSTLLDIGGLLDNGLEEIDLRVNGRAFMKYNDRTKTEIENFSKNLNFSKRMGISNF